MTRWVYGKKMSIVGVETTLVSPHRFWSETQLDKPARFSEVVGTSSQFENTYFTAIFRGFELGTHLGLIDSCINKL